MGNEPWPPGERSESGVEWLHPGRRDVPAASAGTDSCQACPLSAEARGTQRGLLLGGFCFSSGGLGVDSTRACSSMITGRLCGLRLLTGHVLSWALGQAGSQARSAQHSPCKWTFAFPRTAESQAPARLPVGAKATRTYRRMLWTFQCLAASGLGLAPSGWKPPWRAGILERPGEARATCSALTACSVSTTSRVTSCSDTWPSAASEPLAVGQAACPQLQH